jgi:hypothetical protein
MHRFRLDLGEVDMKRQVWLAFFVIPVLAFGLATNVAASEGQGESLDLTATLSPGPGSDLRGTAEVTINLSTSVLCWELEYTTTEHPIAAHIHRGAAGVNGPVVFGFFPNFNEGCRPASPTEVAVIRDIANAPGNFYVNVHTTAHPGGAGRGQLSTNGDDQESE